MELNSLYRKLETERLVLRKLNQTDAKEIFQYQSDKKNFKFVDMPVYTDMEEAKNYINKMNKGIEQNKWLIWAISDKRTTKILGTISIWNIRKEKAKAELGYGLFPGNLGKGIMSEALKKVLEFAFYNLTFELIEAYTNRENIRSIELLKRNKFKKYTTITESSSISGKPLEMVVYRMNKKDFMSNY